MKNLKDVFNERMKSLGPVIRETPWEDPKVYAQWLAQTWYFVKESTRLLNLCGAYMPQEFEGLHNRFIDHAKEEQGHATILLRDLKGLGEDVVHFEEYEETSAFYQSQYYLIHHKNPLEFFGYILLLEGVAVGHGEEIFERVKDIHGRKSVNFLQIHGAEDPDHLEKAMKQLEEMTGETQLRIIENFHKSAFFYERIMQRIALSSIQTYQKVG